MARSRKLRPLDAGAVARVIEYASRIVSDSIKVSAHMRSLVDILSESDYWTGLLGNEVIGSAEVQKAIDTRIYRLDRRLTDETNDLAGTLADAILVIEDYLDSRGFVIISEDPLPF